MVNVSTPEPIDRPPMTQATLRMAWAQRLRSADLAAVHLISRSARPKIGRYSAIAISKLGNSWLYLIILPVIFAALGREGFRVVFLGALNAALLHLMFSHHQAQDRTAAALSGRSAPPVPARCPRRTFLSERPYDDVVRRADADRPRLARRDSLAVALLILMAWSRIATAHHYPSDIFGGAILGIVLAYPLSILVLAIW